MTYMTLLRRLLPTARLFLQCAMRTDWTHLIASSVAAESVAGRAVIDLLHHAGGDGQARGVGKACAQQWVHVILVLKVREGEHSVISRVSVGLCLTSSNVPACLQRTASSGQRISQKSCAKHAKHMITTRAGHIV